MTVKSSSYQHRQRKRRYLPRDFNLDYKREKFARDYWAFHGRFDLNVEDEFVRFRTYHTAKGSLMSCWDSAWQIWYSNAVRFNRLPLGKKMDAFNRLCDRSWALDCQKEMFK